MLVWNGFCLRVIGGEKDEIVHVTTSKQRVEDVLKAVLRSWTEDGLISFDKCYL